ncbi:hypothetical protein DMB42_07485 [Nonomuraea sp. WAC 01424]|uniref:hypothetical protein n=1 Tax=Nonomuraea sp. WAC 01424 TaxID=2203200 RepID=UPI000F79C136|nr:hypothetical protein [Nonomuraea sp. WAC 01424]RSN14352.1 hypothetical protein DMB42_07485 [Nonomuraea sp. WAC 01424]
MESFGGLSDPAVQRMREEQRRLAAAHAISRVARLAMGVFTGSLGMLTSLVSQTPTNHNWDPGMPDYSDPDLVLIATGASGFAVFFFALTMAFFWRSKIAVAVSFPFLAGELYRFATVVPHFTG